MGENSMAETDCRNSGDVSRQHRCHSVTVIITCAFPSEDYTVLLNKGHDQITLNKIWRDFNFHKISHLCQGNQAYLYQVPGFAVPVTICSRTGARSTKLMMGGTLMGNPRCSVNAGHTLFRTI